MMIAATENIVEKIPAKMICESCGGEFSCGAKLGECWCFAVELKPEVLTDLRENFKNCLCEDCLTQQNTRGIFKQNNLAANEND